MEIGYKECPECKGQCSFLVTDCCGEEAYSNGDRSTADYSICPYCKDYCEYGSVKCEVCHGSGVIPRDENDDFWDEMHEHERRTGRAA